MKTTYNLTIEFKDKKVKEYFDLAAYTVMDTGFLWIRFIDSADAPSKKYGGSNVGHFEYFSLEKIETFHGDLVQEFDDLDEFNRFFEGKLFAGENIILPQNGRLK